MRRTIPTPARSTPGCARARGRQDQHLGTPGAAPFRLRFQSHIARRLRRRLAHLLRRYRALLRQSRLCISASPATRKICPICPTAFSSVAVKLTAGGVETARQPRKKWTGAHAVSRGRNHRWSEAQQIPQPLFRPRRVRPARRRLRYPRRLRFAHRPDSSRHGYRQSDFAAPTPRLRSHRRQGHGQGAAASTSSIPKPTRPTKRRAAAVILGASTLESARLMLLSKSSQHPNGIGNSSGHVGHNFCEHIMGPGIIGIW